MPITNLLITDDPGSINIPASNLVILNPLEYLESASARQYPAARVFNLCHSYAYQSIGYYVSLLAEARSHRAIPTVTTLRDFNSALVVRSLGEEIEEVIQQALRKESGDRYQLRIYFGQGSANGLQRLAAKLYRLFPAPILQVNLVRKERWMLADVQALALQELDDAARAAFLVEAERFFTSRKSLPTASKQRFLYDLAILVNNEEAVPPSDAKALARFIEAARDVGFYTEYITTADMDRICEFDALFIRETTAVDHPTYQMSRLAHAEGLAVIDDPWSILRCANKIYLNEMLVRARIPSPRTWILTAGQLADGRLSELPLPCILKLPDAAFSRGVFRVETQDELRERVQEMLQQSEILLAQEFMPSEYDWRIGVLDNQPLFACKYFMARSHWQIYNWGTKDPKNVCGDTETVHVEFVPKPVIETALKATRLIGDGLYGVDLKWVDNRAVVIEVNDYPSLESGVEDKALGMELYSRIARSLRRRIEIARGTLG